MAKANSCSSWRRAAALGGARCCRRALGVSALGLVTACSGGSGGFNSAQVTGGPPPAAPALISAPQVPLVNSSLNGPLKTETFPSMGVTANTTYSSTALVSSSAGNPASSTTIRYDAASNTYSLTAATLAANGTTPDTATVIPNDVAITSAASAPCTVAPCNSAALLDREGNTQPPFIYSYVGYAKWWDQAASGSNTVRFDNYAVFGIPTPVGAVPRSGSASYTLDLNGFEATKPDLGASAPGPEFTGQGTATLDFGAGSYSMNGTITAVTDMSQGGTGVGTFSSQGSILSNANGFGGAFTLTDAGRFDGYLNGWLFGPNAQELGSVFSAESSDGRSVVGTILGHN